MLLAAAVLGAVVFAKREDLQSAPVTERPVKPVSGFEYDMKSKIDYSKIKKHGISEYRGGSGCGEILAFDDMETVEHTLKELEKQLDKYDEAFVAHNSGLDEEELYQIEQEIGYDENKPLTDFNNNLRFSSSNTAYLKAEALYLDQKTQNEEDDPDDHFIGEDVERTILNACNEVMIDDTIYKLTKDGYFEIDDGDFRMLAKLDDVDELDNDDLPDNVRYIQGDNAKLDDIESLPDGGNSKSMTSNSFWSWWRCRTWRLRSGRVTRGSRRIKWSLSHWTYPWGRYVTASTRNYKKWWLGWRKYRTWCAAKVYGKVSRDFFCWRKYDFNPHHHYRMRWSRQVRHRIKVQGRTKSGWVRGWHYGGSGIHHHSPLNF